MTDQDDGAAAGIGRSGDPAVLDERLRGLIDTIVKSAPIGIALLDAELRFVLVNRALAEINGVAAGDHVGRSLSDVVPDLVDAESAFRAVLETGQPIVGLELEGETAASPGQWRTWSEDIYRVESDGVVVGVAALVTETTEQQQNQRRVGRIIDALGTFVGLLDLEGNVLEANDHALAAAALTRDDVIGRPFWDTYWWSHDRGAQDRLRDAVRQAADGEEVRYDATIRVAAGALTDIDFQLFPLIENGTITGLVPSGVDISDRRAATRRSQALGRFSQALAVAENTGDVAGAVIGLLPAALDADFANLALVEEASAAVVFVHPPGMPGEIAERYSRSDLSARNPLTDAVREDRRVVIGDLDEYRDRYPDMVEDTSAAGLVATASIPLHFEGEVVAAVGLGWGRPLTVDHTLEARFQVVAELTGSALGRSRTADNRHRFLEELRDQLVPDTVDHPELDIAVRYRAAGRSIGFGGDWYDVVELSEGRAAIVIGDVVGHGVVAAARMSVLRTVLNSVVRLGTPLAETFDVAEPLLAEFGRGYLGTALIAVVDPVRQQVAYTSAGHPPPFLVRPGERPLALEGASRRVLGLGPHRASAATETFPPGSTIVAYTDGLIEHGRQDIDVGIARVAGAIEAVSSTASTSSAIADAVLATMDDAADLQDDVALVVVRLT